MITLRLLALCFFLASCGTVQATTLVDTTTPQTLSNKTLDSTTTYQPTVTSWTPTVGGSSTYTQQLGTSIKVGKLVTLFFSMVLSSIGSGSTSQISGFPYTADVPNGSCVVGFFNGLSTNVVYLSGIVSSTVIVLEGLTAAGSGINVNAVLQNSAGVTMMCTYQSTT